MMDDELMEIDFPTEDEVRKRPPAGTTALVQVRPNKEGQLELKTGKHEKFGPWMSIPFEVIEGEYRGEWANMMLNLKPDDMRFRRTFEVVTGIDVTQGAKVEFTDFKNKLLGGVFEAEIGPEKKQGEETGYTKCFKLTRVVGTRDDAEAGADTSVPEIGNTAPADEDIPF